MLRLRNHRIIPGPSKYISESSQPHSNLVMLRNWHSNRPLNVGVAPALQVHIDKAIVLIGCTSMGLAPRKCGYHWGVSRPVALDL